MIYGMAENPRPTGKCVKYVPVTCGLILLCILFFSLLTFLGERVIEQYSFIVNITGNYAELEVSLLIGI